MHHFQQEQHLRDIPLFKEPQVPDLEVRGPNHYAQDNHQRRILQTRASTFRSQKRLSAIPETPDSRPCSTASSESSNSKGSEPAITISGIIMTPPSPTAPPSLTHVKPPTDYQVQPQISHVLISETVVCEYRISGPYPEVESYRYDVPGERGNTHQERGNAYRERGNTHGEFYQHPDFSNSSEIPNNARRERTYSDRLVEIDDDWRRRDLGQMYKGEQVDHIRRGRARERTGQGSRRQREREYETNCGRGLRIRCVIL